MEVLVEIKPPQANHSSGARQGYALPRQREIQKSNNPSTVHVHPERCLDILRPVKLGHCLLNQRRNKTCEPTVNLLSVTSNPMDRTSVEDFQETHNHQPQIGTQTPRLSQPRASFDDVIGRPNTIDLWRKGLCCLSSQTKVLNLYPLCSSDPEHQSYEEFCRFEIDASSAPKGRSEANRNSIITTPNGCYAYEPQRRQPLKSKTSCNNDRCSAIRKRWRS